MNTPRSGRYRTLTVLMALGVLGTVGVGLWVRRALLVYREETAELEARVPPDPLPERDGALMEIREVSWSHEGERQRGWFIPPRNGALIVYLHGSPGSRASLLPEARALARSGFGGLLLDLPGYGSSEGSRTWGAPYARSIVTAVDFIVREPRVDPSRVALFGYSMGTNVAAGVAAVDPRIRALVLSGAFTRLDEQLRSQFRGRLPWVEELAIVAAKRAGLDVGAFDTTASLRRVGEKPVFLIAGANDSAVPPAHARQLAAVAANAELWVVSGVGHVGLAERVGEPYFERLGAFFGRALGPFEL
ncbi:MAG: alpha/beta fold hydrolase [Polyangiaceae bacterium]|nr:alpha/beta fold hydrolase [Polyangiaceae bacterium]